MRAAASSEDCRIESNEMGVASLGRFGEAISAAWELGARRALSGVWVVARTEAGRVNRGGPPARHKPGRVCDSEPPYKVKAEVGGGAEGVGAGRSTSDSPDNRTGDREGSVLRSCWRRRYG